MPTAPKRSDNLSGHRTEAELSARQEAEQQVLPDRGGRIRLKKPRFISGNKLANSYWNQLVKRMEGLSILDDLDSEMLAGYCAMLSRRDQTIILIHQLMDRLGVQDVVETASNPKKAGKADMTDEEWENSARASDPPMTADQIIEAVSKLDTLNGKLQALDRNLLQYADKLGLTPTGRVRLAQKRAEKAADVEPDEDLYGD